MKMAASAGIRFRKVLSLPFESIRNVFTAGNIETETDILDRLRQIYATNIICRWGTRNLGQL